GPVHGLDVELRARAELACTLAGELDDRVRLHGRFQPERPGRTVDARGMAVAVRHHALEDAGAVENGGALPEGVAARPHERRIALVPAAVEPGPRLAIPRLRLPGHRHAPIRQCSCPIERPASRAVNGPKTHPPMNIAEASTTLA